MRRLLRRLPLLVLAATACAAGARADTVQASATLALTLSATGPASEKVGKSGREIVSAPLETLRLGNRQILEDMLVDGDLPGNSIAGWHIVALWANWPDANPYQGNGYRFFARRGKGKTATLVEISPYRLSLAPLQAAVGYRREFAGEALLGGTEKYTVLSQANFGIRGFVGAPIGVHSGTGRFVRAGETVYYVPGATKVPLNGLFEVAGEELGGVVNGSLSISAAKRVADAPSQSLGGSVNFSSVSVVGTNSVAGDLAAIFVGSLFPPIDLVADPLGGTLTLGGPRNVSFSPPPESTASITLVLSAGRAGTLTLGTGETLDLAAGDTLPLNTLSIEQLSPLAWTPAR